MSDKVIIRDLLVRGIVGINPEERKNRQDILVNIVMEANTRHAATTDCIEDAVNYRTVAKAVIAYIEVAQPLLVEKLAMELCGICFETDARIEAVELTVEKPGALRFAKSVGVTVYRRRDEPLGEQSGAST